MSKKKNKKNKKIAPPLTYLEVGSKYKIKSLSLIATCVAEESEYYVLIDTDNNEVQVPKNKVGELIKVSK